MGCSHRSVRSQEDVSPAEALLLFWGLSAKSLASFELESSRSILSAARGRLLTRLYYVRDLVDVYSTPNNLWLNISSELSFLVFVFL